MKRFKAIVLTVVLMLIPANLELPSIEVSLFDINIEQMNLINVTFVSEDEASDTE